MDAVSDREWELPKSVALRLRLGGECATFCGGGIERDEGIPFAVPPRQSSRGGNSEESTHFMEDMRTHKVATPPGEAFCGGNGEETKGVIFFCNLNSCYPHCC